GEERSMTDVRKYNAAESERVLRLAAVAIATVMKRRVGAQLPEGAARELGSGGTIGDAIHRLERRLSVRRSADGVYLDRRSQMRMASAEVVAERKGMFEGG